MNVSIVDMDSSTIILEGGDEAQIYHELQNVEVAPTLQNQASWINQTFPTITVPALNQQPLLPQGEGVYSSVSMMDQQQPSAQDEGVVPCASMMEGTALHQQLSAQGEGGVQPSFQTSRNEAIPGTSSGRIGRKRNSKGEDERDKKLPKYMWDPNDPRLTPEQRDSVKNSKNAKRNRDKKNDEMHKLQQKCDDLKKENENLKMEKKTLLAKLYAQYQELQQHQTRLKMIEKLATSSPGSSKFQ